VEAAVAEAAVSAPVEVTSELAALPFGSFDDIVYVGSDAGRIEELERRLAPRGVIDVVLGGEVPERPVEVDVGRIHYDLTRWVGTTGSSAAEGYAMAPGTAELRDGERVVVIGAAGPMGFMHVIRALTSDRHDLDVTAVDIDPARLEHLADVAAPIAAAHGVDFRVVDSRETQLTPGFTRLGVMVPSPALAADAVRLAGDGAILDLFAGFAVGTRAALDLGELIRKRVYMIGTSGSVISDMKAVLAKLEARTLDTNISVDAVAGMEGVAEALAAVQARTSGGKIVIYPALGSVGMVRLPELAASYPEVAAKLDEGRWTRAAEEALLATAGATPSEAGRG
jgi:D-arabinose 1-dehydrogenase-like Zn-dependent alcohol dehydrogenase